jgi:hypothetical protein
VRNRKPSDSVDSAFPTVDRHSMNKGRFLNQKLGKRASRKVALLKSGLSVSRQPRRPEAPATRFPKKGASREKGLISKLAVTLGRQGASNLLPCYTLEREGLVGPPLKELFR